MTTAQSGYLSPAQLEHVFEQILTNKGSLTPEIIAELATFYEWDTYTTLKNLCCYINGYKAAVNHEDLKAICMARTEADNLKNQLKEMETAFMQKCTEYTELSNKYCENSQQLANSRAECINLDYRLKALQNRLSVEKLLSGN